jgi:hypothetical protein
MTALEENIALISGRVSLLTFNSSNKKLSTLTENAKIRNFFLFSLYLFVFFLKSLLRPFSILLKALAGLIIFLFHTRDR